MSNILEDFTGADIDTFYNLDKVEKVTLTYSTNSVHIIDDSGSTLFSKTFGTTQEALTFFYAVRDTMRNGSDIVSS